MNRSTPFIFNDKFYYVGTIVKINEKWQKYVRFNSILKFTGYSVDEQAYCFTTLHDNLELYKLSNEQISLYIENILKEGVMGLHDKNVNPKYIDGIVSAWIWYVLIMFFTFFLQGAENVIVIWFITTFIFLSWRHRKIKGG